jgi:ectoine hydroxylase-related dioxygenase (phytanoyl-CoA dioxygenase family)
VGDLLAGRGWVVLEGLAGADEVAAAAAALRPLLDAAPYGANSFVGRRTKRVFGLPAKTRALDRMLTHPDVLGLVEATVGPHLLSTAVAVEIHPGETAQTPHTDGSAWPVPASAGEIVVNAIWALDDFAADNGATIVAGETALMSAGSVLVYVGSLEHGGGANTSSAPRLAVVAGYTAAWLRQQETFTLTCPPEVAATVPAELAGLLGYRLYPPFVGHVDGRDPSELLGPPKRSSR